MTDAGPAARRVGLRETDVGSNVLPVEPLDRVVLERTTMRDDLVLVAPSQLAADLLTGPGESRLSARSSSHGWRSTTMHGAPGPLWPGSRASVYLLLGESDLAATVTTSAVGGLAQLFATTQSAGTRMLCRAAGVGGDDAAVLAASVVGRRTGR